MMKNIFALIGLVASTRAITKRVFAGLTFVALGEGARKRALHLLSVLADDKAEFQVEIGSHLRDEGRHFFANTWFVWAAKNKATAERLEAHAEGWK